LPEANATTATFGAVAVAAAVVAVLDVGGAATVLASVVVLVVVDEDPPHPEARTAAIASTRATRYAGNTVMNPPLGWLRKSWLLEGRQLGCAGHGDLLRPDLPPIVILACWLNIVKESETFVHIDVLIVM
jgi:hypothetical protein